MFTALFKAFAQLSDPRVRRLVWGAVGGAVAVYVVLYGAVAWTLGATAIFEAPWAEAASDILGGVAVLVLTLLLFPAVVTLVAGFLLEDVAAAVEAKHYPDLPAVRQQPMWDSVAAALRFAAVAVVLNLLALPLYFIPVLNLAVFYALNGYLLGREYFELVAARRMDGREAAALRRARIGPLWLAGAAIAFLSTVPLVNLLAPIIATSMMVHVFQALRRG